MPQNPRRVTQIAPEIFDWRHAARIAALFFIEGGWSHGAQRRQVCLFGAHACLNIGCRFLFEKTAQFFIEFCLSAFRIQQRPETASQFCKHAGLLLSTIYTTWGFVDSQGESKPPIRSPRP